MTIFYGGTKEQVEKQLNCGHYDWHGPCIDDISRFYKCPHCFCLDRDCTKEEYYYRVEEEDERKTKELETVIDTHYTKNK